MLYGGNNKERWRVWLVEAYFFHHVRLNLVMFQRWVTPAHVLNILGAQVFEDIQRHKVPHKFGEQLMIV